MCPRHPQYSIGRCVPCWSGLLREEVTPEQLAGGALRGFLREHNVAIREHLERSMVRWERRHAPGSRGLLWRAWERWLKGLRANRP